MGKYNNMICTISLIVMNAVVFLYLSFGGMTEDGYYMLEHGAMYVPYFLEGKEYYRIISCMFLHFGFEHFFQNMVFLFHHFAHITFQMFPKQFPVSIFFQQPVKKLIHIVQHILQGLIQLLRIDQRSFQHGNIHPGIIPKGK